MSRFSDSRYQHSDHSDNDNSDFTQNQEEDLRNPVIEEGTSENTHDYDIIDEALIPMNSSIENYNQHFYELYEKIRTGRTVIPDLVKSLDDYIIIPKKINFDEDLEITVNCLRALSYASTKYWGTHQNLARMVLVDIFFSYAFFWDSVYDDTWNEELLSFGI